MDLDWAVRPELARAVVAGWLTGLLVGLLCLGVLMIGLAREPAWASRVPKLRVSLPILGIVAAHGMMFGWTLIGVLFGFAYWARPGILFSAGVLLVAVLGGGLYWTMRSGARGSEPMIVWGSLLIATLAFGVALPVLAEAI